MQNELVAGEDFQQTIGVSIYFFAPAHQSWVHFVVATTFWENARKIIAARLPMLIAMHYVMAQSKTLR